MSGNLLNYINGGFFSTKSVLGGGIPGGQANGLLGGGANANGGSGMEGGGVRSTDRQVLRKAFGNNQLSQTYGIQSPVYYVTTHQSKTTPFRAAMAAGDPNGTKNAAPSPLLPSASQVQAPRVQGTQNNPGGVKYGSQAGGAFYTGNPKYVYDGSDYTRYKHLKAVNQTYDDSSFGGANNGAYVFLKRVRRF